jgi:hypothetical protein
MLVSEADLAKQRGCKAVTSIVDDQMRKVEFTSDPQTKGTAVLSAAMIVVDNADCFNAQTVADAQRVLDANKRLIESGN